MMAQSTMIETAAKAMHTKKIILIGAKHGTFLPCLELVVVLRMHKETLDVSKNHRDGLEDRGHGHDLRPFEPSVFR